MRKFTVLHFDFTFHDRFLLIIVTLCCYFTPPHFIRTSRFFPVKYLLCRLTLIYLANKEDIPFSFSMDKSSIAADDKILEVSPMKDVVHPGKKLPITITFTPNQEKKYNFNLIFNVKHKPASLSLNVKGEGHTIHDAIHVESDEGQVCRNFEVVGTQIDLTVVFVNPKILLITESIDHLRDQFFLLSIHLFYYSLRHHRFL